MFYKDYFVKDFLHYTEAIALAIHERRENLGSLNLMFSLDRRFSGIHMEQTRISDDEVTQEMVKGLYTMSNRFLTQRGVNSNTNADLSHNKEGITDKFVQMLRLLDGNKVGDTINYAIIYIIPDVTIDYDVAPGYGPRKEHRLFISIG